jgi:hypothetical protein
VKVEGTIIKSLHYTIDECNVCAQSGSLMLEFEGYYIRRLDMMSSKTVAEFTESNSSDRKQLKSSSYMQ